MIDSDPSLSLNIYACGRKLDEIIINICSPLNKIVRNNMNGILWLMRYSFRGEHVKIRIHSGLERCASLEEIRTEIIHIIDQYFKCSSTVSSVSTVKRSEGPPIDLEERLITIPLGTKLAWTTYRRTAISHPASPWLEQDVFIMHACKCLGEGTTLVCEQLNGRINWTLGERQVLFCALILVVLLAFGKAEPISIGLYTRYHRDWLLRFFIRSKREEKNQVETFTRIAGGCSQTVSTMCRLIDDPKLMNQLSELASISVALIPFAESVLEHFDEQDYLIDPHCDNVYFPPIFKLLHGISNQAGIHPMQEAYACHLLGSAAARINS
jgi:hypothetical protein